MEIRFSKYHGTGNDFILIDNRAGNIVFAETEVARLCHRRFGIGADGLMLLETSAGADFRMVYYNSDGRQSSMCGNGGRCIIKFAERLGMIVDWAKFEAIDGLHTGRINADETVSLHMGDVTGIDRKGEGIFVLDTGSPHYVRMCSDVKALDLVKEGRAIRYSDSFSEAGINVNFAEQGPDGLFVRTYERGVEDETLSCGTGVTAAAIASVAGKSAGAYNVAIVTPGGALRVSFAKAGSESASDVVLHGAAVHVFDGLAVVR